MDELKKQTAEYRKKKEETEEMEAIRDFENLQKSWVYKSFPFVAVFGIAFSLLLFLDFHLTPHFEFVAGECVKGISKVALDSEIPIAFGVLTVDTVEQAIERSGSNSENKGAEAAESTIRMINLLEKL